MSVLGDAESQMVSIIDGITTSDGYNFNWGSTNLEDMANVDDHSFDAYALIYWDGEDNTDEIDGAHASAYANVAEYRIIVRVPLTEKSNNPELDIRANYHKAVDDLKKVFNAYYDLNGTVLYIQYQSSRIIDVDQGNRFLPSELETRWTVKYYQDRSSPTTFGN